MSTFSALLMLRREHELGYDPEQRTIAYNGRPIPLAEYVPNLPHPGEHSHKPAGMGERRGGPDMLSFSCLCMPCHSQNCRRGRSSGYSR